MADETPKKSGLDLPKLALIVGGLLAAAGTVLESLAQAGIGEKWVGGALAVVGFLLGLFRNLIKGQAVEASEAAGEAAKADAADKPPEFPGVKEFK